MDQVWQEVLKFSASVSNALLRLVSVSETSKPLLSSSTLRVSELLQMSLPALSSASFFLSPLSCRTDNGSKTESRER